MITHQSYPGDVTDAEREFVLPYLRLLPEDAGRREHDLRDVTDALRWIVSSGALPALPAGRLPAVGGGLPADPPPAASRRSSTTSTPCSASPPAAILDGRTIRSTVESGGRAGYDGYERRKGSEVHFAVDALGHPLALRVTPAGEQERAQVGVLAEAVQAATDKSVELAHVDQGYAGEAASDAAAGHGIALEVVKLPEAERGFVPLPRRWVVERSFGWMARPRRLARDYERLSETLAGLHYVAFSLLMLHKAAPHFVWCS